MGFKKAILVLLLLIILTMGAASAADNNTTSDNLAATEDKNLELNENDEVLSIDSTDVISDPGNGSYTPGNGSIVTGGTFSDLNTLIQNAGSELNLSENYTYINGDPTSITIDKQITINGNGITIDANNNASVFKIVSDYVKINNITFINCRNETGCGGAIYCTGINFDIYNCSFINCYANDGGSIYCNSYGDSISSCDFINSSASNNGGAINIMCQGDIITNCIFTNCHATRGGAIYSSPYIERITNCIFVNCSANYGGAYLYSGNEVEISNCLFVKCSANYGGAIFSDTYSDGEIRNSEFINLTGSNGPAIYDLSNILEIINSTFEDKTAQSLNDLIYGGIITNCTLNGISNKYADLNMRIDSNIIGTCKIGDTIELTATVYNNGPDDAKNVSAHFAIPPSLEIIGNTPYAGSFDSMTGIWNIPEIFSTSWATLTITCQAIKAENTTVNAFVSSDAEDLNLTDNNASANLFILRADTTLTLNVSDIFAGETLRIFIDITPFDATGNLTINIGGVEEQSFINGSDVIMKEGLSAGEYNITATYSGNANYLPTQSTTSFRVNKRNVNLTISLDENTITYGQNATLTAIMPIDGNIAININNETYNITTIAGTAHLQIPAQPAGNHTITATFEGNDQYNPANTTIILTVNRADPPITINTTDIKYGEAATITVTTPTDATGTITLTVNGENYIKIKNIENGQATFNITGLDAGNYEAIANYTGDANYMACQNTTQFRVSKAPTEISVASDVVNLKVLEEFAPGATLIPDVGYLTFTSYDSSIAIVLNGTIKAIGAGSTIITVNFEGNDNYEASNKTINVTVTLNDASISVNNSTLDLKVGDSFSIAATTIPDDLNVTYIPDDSGVVSVDENGVVTALKEGNGVITVRVGGDGIYAENSTTINVSVGKTDVILTISTEDITYGENATITATMSIDGTVTVNINNENIAIEITNGTGQITIPNLNAGEYNIKATFEGNDHYKAANATTTLTVAKAQSQLTIQPIPETTQGENINIIINVQNDATGTITLTVNGENYIKNIENGQTTFNITGLNAGNYEAIANYTGDANYMACQNTTQFRVSKAPTEISVASDVVNLKVLEEFATEATLIPDVGYLTYISNDSSIAIVLNDTIKATGAGSTIITVNFEGNNNYEASNKTINVTVTLNDASISVNNSTLDLKVGESFSIAATTIPDDLNVTYIPDDSGVVSVSENGVVTALKEGNGIITVRVGGDGIYAQNSTTVNVSVGKKDTILTISAEDTTYGENTTITATMSIDGTVTVNINNENIALEITNGTGQITIPNLNAGEYNIKATFEGNDHYKAANATTTLTVTKIQSMLTIQPIPETAQGEDITIIINVQNDATGTITLTVNGENYIKNIENGQTTFNITGLDAGNYEAIANYTGDTNYLASQNSTQFTVKSSMKTFEDIANIISNAHAGDTINLEGTYYGTGSTITVNKELSIKGNGETILDAKNLSGILSVSANNVRINNIRFINGKINANGGAINWIGKNGTISNCTFINCSAENGGSVYWNAENGMINTSTFDHTTATQNGGAIYWNANNGEITDSIFTNSYAQNGGAVYVPENRNVEIKSSIFDNNIAEEESGAVYGGTVDDDCTFKNNTYTPLNTTTIISINETAVYTGNEISITTLILSQKGGLVNTGTVEIYINSKLITTIPANTAYIYKTGDLGTYQVLAKFNDDSSYKDSSSTAEFTVIPIDIPEEIETSTAGIFTLEFPDDAEGTLTVFIDGTKYKVYDIIGGILKIDLSDKKGKYNITFEYSGDKNYPAFKKDANITVETNPSITASNAKVIYSAGTTYKITVYKNKGITANSVNVVIKQNNKKFKTIKTNSKGIASFKVTQTPGTYKLKITSLGKTVTKTLTVKHIVTLKTATVKKSAKKLILQATLAKVNKKYLKKKTITFKFNGKKYKTKTNSKGVAKVTIKSNVLKKLKVGKKITYQATYVKDTIKKTTKVKK